ncbi:MAG: helix-turn-helix domain-containing protein [Dolichospermum sp.]
MTLEGIIFIVMDYEIKVSIEMDITPIASFYWEQDHATKLRQYRESAGLSRAKLSEITGIAEGYIQQIENPKLLKRKQVTIGADTFAKICKALQINISNFFWKTS